MINLKTIKADDLCRMGGSEGLILQGCGGDLREWVDGVNEMLTEDGILLDGTAFKTEAVSSFEYENLTNLLFPFTSDVKLDMGKLAMWRLQTHGQFGGTWLSDYVENNLRGFDAGEQPVRKPDCALIGQNGNIYNLMGIASRTLKENGMRTEAKEMCDRITSSGSYDEALGIIGEYVNITSGYDPIDGEDEDMGGMKLE